jgi:hypothetical protein
VGVEGVLGLLDGVPEGVDDGAVVSQLVHVDLRNEHSGSVALEDVQGVVSVVVPGVNLLSLGSLNEHFRSNLLRLACW